MTPRTRHSCGWLIAYRDGDMFFCPNCGLVTLCLECKAPVPMTANPLRCRECRATTNGS